MSPDALRTLHGARQHREGSQDRKVPSAASPWPDRPKHVAVLRWRQTVISDSPHTALILLIASASLIRASLLHGHSYPLSPREHHIFPGTGAFHSQSLLLLWLSRTPPRHTIHPVTPWPLLQGLFTALGIQPAPLPAPCGPISLHSSLALLSFRLRAFSAAPLCFGHWCTPSSPAFPPSPVRAPLKVTSPGSFSKPLCTPAHSSPHFSSA